VFWPRLLATSDFATGLPGGTPRVRASARTLIRSPRRRGTLHDAACGPWARPRHSCKRCWARSDRHPDLPDFEQMTGRDMMQSYISMVGRLGEPTTSPR